MANKKYTINPFEAAKIQFLCCKNPKHTGFVYQFQQNKELLGIGDKIRYVRLQAGFSQTELAKLAGIDRTTLTRLENGQVSEKHMKTDILLKIASMCGFEETFCCDRYHTVIASNAGLRIKHYRQSIGMTQHQFAEYLEVCRETVKRWESNQCKPTKDVLIKLFPQSFAE